MFYEILMFYFRWLTRRHLHVSARIATDSVNLVEPLCSTPDPSEQSTRTGSVDRQDPQKRGRKRKITGPSLLVESKMKDFLDHVESIKDTLGLEDLERYRPERRPMPSSPEFEVEYNALCDKLTHAFTKQQLRVFLNLYGLHLATKYTKLAHVTMIMEDAWSWPSLKKIKQEKIDWTEISQRNFPMDPRRSFLLMGKDGTDLLNLSKNFNVHVALLSNPLSLKVEGFNGALNQFDAYLKNFDSDIELEVTTLPSNRTISQENLESISRLSGAYLEFQGAKLHITFRRSKAETAVVAKRLAVQAAFERLGESTQAIYLPPGSIGQPMSSQSYSLYPFFSPQSLPWKIQSRNAFRLRRVGKWLSSDTLPVLQNTNVLVGGGTALSDEGNDIDIRVDLLDKLSKYSKNHSPRTFTASTGHFLVLSSLDEPTTLIPPLRGPQDVSTVLKWTKNHSNRVVFHPSLPKSLMESLPYKQHVLHRFVYIAQSVEKNDSTDGQPSAELLTTLTLEIVSENSAMEESSTPRGSCRLGIEASMDLLIPDRITDLRFSATDSESLDLSQWPEELQSLAHRMEADNASPDIPLSFRYGDTDYALHSNSNVRQIHKTMADDHDPQASISPETADFVIETILDPSNNESRTLCKVTCSDHTSDVEWQAFLSKCDWLVQLFEEGEKTNAPDMFTVEMQGHPPDRKDSSLQRIHA